MASTTAEIVSDIRNRTGLSTDDISDDALTDIVNDEIAKLEMHIEESYSIRLHEAIIKLEAANQAMFWSAIDEPNIGMDYKLGDLEETGSERVRVAFKFIQENKRMLDRLYMLLEHWLEKKEETESDSCYMTGIYETIDVTDDQERDHGFEVPQRHYDKSTLWFW
jgi:hypothetical protein